MKTYRLGLSVPVCLTLHIVQLWISGLITVTARRNFSDEGRVMHRSVISSHVIAMFVQLSNSSRFSPSSVDSQLFWPI